MTDTMATQTVFNADLSVKIRAVETIPLHIPFGFPFQIATARESSRDFLEALIVRIHTDQGVFGIGETQAWRRQGSAELLANLMHSIHGQFEPLLIGRSPFDVNAIMYDLNATLYNSLYAQAAIGDALYDLMGKFLNVPVHALLGGKSRDRVRVGAVLSMKPTVGALVESAQAFYERGFRHFGLKIGIDPAMDLQNAEALRNTFGDDIVLRVDANASLNFDAAATLLRKLEPFDIDVAEQPVAIWDVDGLAALAKSVAMPIMADESVSTDHSLLDIVKKRAATVVQTKTAKNGGIHYIRRLWHLAEAAGMRIYPGNHPSTSVATSAVAQMCAASPTPVMEGVFAVGVSGALADDIAENPIRPVNGEVPVPDGPGLGITLDEDKLVKYRAAI
jgi:L-alanine-DL-glutamate epimerase-like enolase superfamily enzyme